jgi:uncharacterized protein
MLRPLAPEIDALVDASVQAHASGTVERRFRASQLPRLSEAGIAEPADIRLSIRFSNVDGRIAMDGELDGFVTMTCQRCMQPAKIDVSDEFRLIIVDSETERLEQEDASGGYEPVVADAARLDLRWLVEEQALLSVPLVPKHADENCAAVVTNLAGKEEGASQRPFANLRDMLRDK